jgi:hypothetical protein
MPFKLFGSWQTYHTPDKDLACGKRVPEEEIWEEKANIALKNIGSHIVARYSLPHSPPL